ncbi:MAG: hypothetical protein J6L88_02465 [Clostridia bacterium]|nr:hypothetical protein [Clostridia bacterium]
MKKLWGRVGVTLVLTDQQHAALIGTYHKDEMEGTNQADKLMKSFLADKHITCLDGETYFPENRISLGMSEYDNPDFEMSFDL